jgi:transcriptional regulator
MYLPRAFAADDAQLEALVRSAPLATLISRQGERVAVSHLPLVLEIRNGEWILLGHLACANPHLSLLDGSESLAIFHGPHAYVSPLWYTASDVPTWNYAVGHLEGRARLLSSEAETLRVLQNLSESRSDGWEFSLPEDLKAPGSLLRAIAAFEIPVTSRVGKFKLSQNRSEADFAGVLAALEARQDEGSLGVAQLMRDFRKNRKGESV